MSAAVLQEPPVAASDAERAAWYRAQQQAWEAQHAARQAEEARLVADRERRKRVRPARGTSRTTRQRKIECQSGCGYNLRGSRSWLTKAMPACPLCAGEMWWSDVADMLDALDPLSHEYARIIGGMDARELRSYGLDSYVRQPQGRRAKPNQCDYDGCGKFIGKGAEKCADGHWQAWARHMGLDANDGMPF